MNLRLCHYETDKGVLLWENFILEDGTVHHKNYPKYGTSYEKDWEIVNFMIWANNHMFDFTTERFVWDIEL